MKKILITFSGLDGSGKSTLLETVAFHHKPIQVIHIVHFRLINRLRGKTTASKSMSGTKKPGRLAGWLNTWLMLVDVLVFNMYYTLRPKPVVCDRYFYDLLAVHLYRHQKSRFLPWIIGLAKKPALAVFIHVDPKTAHSRETEGGHDLAYFEKLDEIYQRIIIPRYGLVVIENDSLDKAKKDILKLVEKAGIS